MTEIEWAQLVIRTAVGFVMVAFGLHQIINPGEWKEYIPKWLSKLSPLPDTSFLQSHGVGNLSLGFCFMIGFLPGVFDWIVLIWWASILPFAFMVKWSIALRDVAIIASLVAVILLQDS
ncbi:MAG TPA: hypothetical protein VD735_01795 [Candidatus Saccharimonadales bacterium]|nr:hypothetical protein [Candidatus Saccharimonadales bacterium]